MIVNASWSDYWADLDAELSAVPVSMHSRRDPVRSTPDFEFWEITMSSVGHRGSGHHRIAGFLSVPTAPGPHPGLLELPRHGSVNHTPHSNERERYVVLTVMHRGQRLADASYRAPYPGALLAGAEDPAEYLGRGIVADGLRGLEVLCSHPAVDRDRVGLVGDDIAVLVAARGPQVAAVRVDRLHLTRAWERARSTGSYPLQEINDLRRHRPEAAEAVRRTLTLFEPEAHAPSVSAPTLVCLDDGDLAAGSGLLEALGAGDRLRVSHQDRLDDDARDAWLAARLGVDARSRFLEAALALPGER
ncbi:acetylxylan esterase [Ruania suaedae]|uniref:acetylxylan esterase n=1 Tax=Ruania suaedae TaxID=2897774 RepID=UPI001E61A88F|nr:acetylxylan esterase [Ruania suaedae]UFU03573.1 acetylxylan esterase [Ruania suaedae]